ncbi:hypothetical protein [Pseudomonas plecoglossicida]|uniref:hypothetical protein n=1 Tax=Pseudomonas plecoglossicida TaxID=70775 RepID=UPI0015E42F42|nr:hypothetical protein [Pseudomonas plecoglossicida]MBA1323403.1 hypothetical protein [Pseudomonas plecoglossicida]
MDELQKEELPKQQSPQEAGFVGYCLDSVDFWELMSSAETGIESAKPKPVITMPIKEQKSIQVLNWALTPFDWSNA